MKSRRVIEEADLKQFEANLKRIKGTVHGSDVRSHARVGSNAAIEKPHPSSSLGGSEKQNRNGRAGSNPAHAPSFRSKWESAYANKLALEQRAGIIKAYWYEPFSLWLPGKVRFKPDFLIQYPDGMEQRLEIVEVKGWSKNLRDGKTRLKIAAALFPCFVWRMVYKTKGGGWDGEYL